MAIPTNRSLYEKVKNETKRRFKVYPSAYANGWLVREYKRRGGTFKGSKKSSGKGLSRWYREKWIDVCKLPKIVACGRNRSMMKGYPYCRPSKRINKGTPRTVKEIDKKELKRRCAKKRRTPKKRVLGSKRRSKKIRSKNIRSKRLRSKRLRSKPRKSRKVRKSYK